MGLCALPFGIYGGVCFVIVPQLFAANHVPEPEVATLTSIVLAAGCSSFLLSPILDWRFTRRSYAIVLAVSSALAMASCLLLANEPRLATALLALGAVTATLYVSAIGGWFAALTTPDEKRSLGAWIAVANVAGGGLTAIVGIHVLRDLPYALGAAVLSLCLLLPLPLFRSLAAPAADGRLASESFRAFFRDVFALLRRRSILWTLLLFGVPAASFGLTNVLAGLGGEYHASEQLTGLVCGVGGIIAGVVGSLVVPRLSRHVTPLRLYLVIGGVGALFTLSLLVLPHTPAVFALAWLFESMFQAAAFAVENSLILADVGEESPLAATHYALLYAAPSFSIAAMGAIDGRAYAWRGIDGMYVVDGGAGLVTVILLVMLWRFVRRPETAQATSTVPTSPGLRTARARSPFTR